MTATSNRKRHLDLFPVAILVFVVGWLIIMGLATQAQVANVSRVDFVNGSAILSGPNEITNTVVTGAATIDWSTGSAHYLSLTAATTLTLTNPVAGATYTLLLQQDAMGSRTVTWPGTVAWSGGSAPTLTTAATKTDLVTFTYSAVLTKYLGRSTLNY